MSIYALKSRFQALLRPVVRLIHGSDLTANHVTVLTCIASVAIGSALMVLPPRWFAILPVWMLIRMALNAIDGMLAREFAQKSALGTYLNELTDVVSDAALYFPFAFVKPFDWRSTGAVIFLSALSEMTGVVGVMTGASRRYDGPMGKSDRAFVFSILAIWVAITNGTLPDFAQWLLWGIAAAVTITIINRTRRGLQELS